MVERLDLGLRRLAVAVPAAVLLSFAGPLQAGESETLGTGPEADVEDVAVLDSESETENAGCESETVLCLHDGRYEATITWTKPNGETGPAKVLRPRTKESGLFYFFREQNWEVLLKVKDGCSYNQHHWVFAASASDVGMELVVRDTTLPEFHADGKRTVREKVYNFPPHVRRPRRPDELPDDYKRDVLERGHPALTEAGAFPDACESE